MNSDSPPRTTKPDATHQLEELVRRLGRRLRSLLWKWSPFVGGLLLGLYFIRIGHVPLDAIEDLLSVGIVVVLLSAAMLLGLLFISAMPILPVLPAIASKTREEWTAWFDGRGRFRTITFTLATLFAPWLVAFVVLVPTEGVPLELKWWTCTALLCGSLAVLAEYAFSHRSADRGPIPPWKTRWVLFRFSGALTCVALSVFPLWVFLTFITHSKFGAEESLAVVWLLLVAGTAVIALFHAGALRIALDSTGIVDALYRSGGAVLFVLFLQAYGLDAWSSLHNRVMRLATVRLERVHLVLKEEACVALPLVGIEPTLRGDKTCALYEVTVLSRLGERWPIACRLWRPSDSKEVISAVIRADDVLEWHPLADKDQALATWMASQDRPREGMTA